MTYGIEINDLTTKILISEYSECLKLLEIVDDYNLEIDLGDLINNDIDVSTDFQSILAFLDKYNIHFDWKMLIKETLNLALIKFYLNDILLNLHEQLKKHLQPHTLH